MEEPRLSYDANENIFHVNCFARKHWSDPVQIRATFAELWVYWNRHIKQRCYTVVDYTGVTMAAELVSTFGEERARANKAMGLGTVRFSSDLTSRTLIRAMSVKIHQPSNIYETRQEAIAVVRGIRSGHILDAESAATSAGAR